MLTIPLDRIAELLDKAAQVDLPDYDSDDEAEEVLASDPTYRELIAAVEALSPAELHQLLTLDRLGDEETDADTWQEAEEAVHAIPEETRLDAVVDALLLAECIEDALEALGYSFDAEADEDEDEEEPANEEPAAEAETEID